MKVRGSRFAARGLGRVARSGWVKDDQLARYQEFHTEPSKDSDANPRTRGPRTAKIRPLFRSGRLSYRHIPHENVLEAHVAEATRVQLQRDVAIE